MRKQKQQIDNAVNALIWLFLFYFIFLSLFDSILLWALCLAWLVYPTVTGKVVQKLYLADVYIGVRPVRIFLHSTGVVSAVNIYAYHNALISCKFHSARELTA